jgi:very-short-patch-repair endonuclease
MKDKPVHNNSELKTKRRDLRNNLTPAEAQLWKYLQRGQLDGRKFRRQHSIGPYIADFYCPSEKLIIELDGQTHFTYPGFDSDEKRTAYLNTLGYTVVRFENKYVFKDPESVLEEIKAHFKIE